MAEPRKQLQWERDALAAGMDPAEVEKRRDLEESLYQAGETAIEVIARQRTATTLLLEGVAPEDMNEKIDLDKYPPERLNEFRDEVRRCLEHLGFELPNPQDAGPKPPPPPPQKHGGQKRKGRK